MWISAEDARSDFILAAAALFLGVGVVQLVSAIPIYPRTGIPFYVLSVAWLVLLSCGAPWALARYRNHVPSAFALTENERGSAALALTLAAPLLLGHVLEDVLSGDVGRVLLSLTGRFTVLSPTIGEFQFTIETLVVIVSVLLLALGSGLTGTFLAVRARDAFRSPDMDVTELLRTFGMGAVGLSLVMGALAAISVGDASSLANALLRALSLLAVVLLADRAVPPRVTVPRAAVIGPAIAVLALWIIAFGGPFGGDLLQGLAAGSAAATITLAAAALVQVRQGLPAFLLLAASAIYPVGDFPMQPLPLPLLLG